MDYLKPPDKLLLAMPILAILFYGATAVARQPTWPPGTASAGEDMPPAAAVILSPQIAERAGNVDLATCRAYPQAGLLALTPVPCATVTSLPVGADRVWMETRNWISPSPLPLRCPASRSPCSFSFPLLPAGSLRWNDPPPGSEDLSLWLVGVGGAGSDEPPGLEMVRALSITEAVAGVQMPEGRVFPLLLRAKTREILAVGKPVEVRPGSETTFDLEPPAQTDLLVVLRRTEGDEAIDGDDVQMRLLGDWPEGKPADAMVSSAERLYAVWSDLPVRGRPWS